MSSHLSEPGEMIEETVASTFAAVPEVPVSKRTIRRTARLGKPAVENDGELPLLASLTNALGAWKRWKDARTANTLKGSFQAGHDRRNLTLATFVQGLDGTYSALGEGEGRSSSQRTRNWEPVTGFPGPKKFKVYAVYPGSRPIGAHITDVRIEVIGGTATIGTTLVSGRRVTFQVLNPDSHPEVLLRVRAREDRDYGPTGSDLPGALSELDEKILVDMT